MGQPALDKMIDIADAFDRGAFAGTSQVDTTEIASVVGLPPASISRLLSRNDTGFRQVTKRRRSEVKADRIYTSPPPTKLPNVSRKSTNPDLRRIVEAIANHELPRKIPIGLFNTRLGIDLIEGRTGRCLPKHLHAVLLKAGFTCTREGTKSVTRPARWEQPPLWPELFTRQRMLRRNGMKISTIYRVTDAAAKNGGIIEQAMHRLDLSRVPYDARSALKRQIQRVIQEAYGAWLRELSAGMTAEREGLKLAAAPSVDWAAVAALTDAQQTAFIKVAARTAASDHITDEPGVYALRWVIANLPGAGQVSNRP